MLQYINKTRNWFRAIFNRPGVKKEVCKSESLESRAIEICPWKKVVLGTYKNMDSYRAALKDAGLHTTLWAEKICSDMLCVGGETELNLVVLSPKDIGFNQDTVYSEVCGRALELGLELCPLEVGPALRLQYRDQPCKECLIIATNITTDCHGRGSLLLVGNDEGLWLGVDSGRTQKTCRTDHRLVFVKPLSA